MFSLEKILDFFIPRRCAGCGGANEAFCLACRTASSQKNTGCLLCGFRNDTGEFCHDCRRKFNTPLKSVLWAGRYDGALKKAIWELKYGKRREMAKPLAEMLAKKFLQSTVTPFEKHAYSPVPIAKQSRILGEVGTGELLCSPRQSAQGLSNGAPSPFVIIPIPLHFKRQYERGFNQAELIAKEFSKITGIEMRNDILEKIKETPAQVKIESKELRLKNLEGVFRLTTPLPLLRKEGTLRSSSPLQGEGWEGYTIILIDDVSTTGATLMHAAQALKNAGAKEIIGLVIAHG